MKNNYTVAFAIIENSVEIVKEEEKERKLLEKYSTIAEEVTEELRDFYDYSLNCIILHNPLLPSHILVASEAARAAHNVALLMDTELHMGGRASEDKVNELEKAYELCTAAELYFLYLKKRNGRTIDTTIPDVIEREIDVKEISSSVITIGADKIRVDGKDLKEFNGDYLDIVETRKGEIDDVLSTLRKTIDKIYEMVI